jgi:hypothetical protein
MTIARNPSRLKKVVDNTYFVYQTMYTRSSIQERPMRINPVIAARQNALRRLAQPVPVLLLRSHEERDGNVVAATGCRVIDLITGDAVWRSPFELVDDE